MAAHPLSSVAMRSSSSYRGSATALNHAGTAPRTHGVIHCRRYCSESETPTPSVAPTRVVYSTPIDTYELMKSFDTHGFNKIQSESLTRAIVTAINASTSAMRPEFMTRKETEQKNNSQAAEMVLLRSDLQNKIGDHQSGLQREIEILRTDIEKMKAELRYEIDKVQASSRLDMNLEKGRTREEMQLVQDKVEQVDKRIEKEVFALKAKVEENKTDVIKFSLGTIASVSAIGLGVLRLMM